MHANACFLCLLIFFISNIFEKLFQEYHQSVKQFDPDQSRHFVGPDLGPNNLQRLSADATIIQTKLLV